MIDVIASIITGDKAAQAQTDAANRAMEFQKGMYDQIRQDNAPWRDAGVKALGQMQDADYMRDFTQADFQADPGYAFRMAEAQKAMERSAAARGGLQSGGFMKELTRYSQDAASQEYQNAYNRFNADRDRRFGRLSQLSGQGQAATGVMSGAAQNYAQSGSEALYGIGNAQAAKWTNIGNTVKDWQAQDRQMAGQAMGSMGMMFCDERLKTDIRPLTKSQIAEFRSTVRPYFFKYKDAKHGQGEFIGPMAQDLERSELGKRLITHDENGNKMVDIGKAVLLLLSLEAGA